jgi:hypothetical protein
VTEGVAVSDTPIYDQLRLELTSERGRQERVPRTRDADVSVVRQRQRRDESGGATVVPAARLESRARRSVSVWSLVNRDK